MSKYKCNFCGNVKKFSIRCCGGIHTNGKHHKVDVICHNCKGRMSMYYKSLNEVDAIINACK